MERILASVKATHDGGHGKSAAGSQRNPEGNPTGGASPEQRAHIRTAQADPNKVTGKVHLCRVVNTQKQV